MNLARHAVLIRQLQGKLNGKAIRVGIATLSYSGAATSADTTVAHGLSGLPSFVIAGGTTGLGKSHVVNYVSGTRTATTFDLRGETRDGAAVTGDVDVFWLAIG